MKRSLALLTVGLLSVLATRARAESGVATPYVVIKDVAVSEGTGGITHFTAEVTLSGWFQPIPVVVQAFPQSAGMADYTFEPVHLTLAPNVPQTIEGDIVADGLVEGTEYFDLRVMGDAYPGNVFSSGGRVTIVDDDGPDGGPPDASPDATPDLSTAVRDLAATVEDGAGPDAPPRIVTESPPPAPDAAAAGPPVAGSSGCAVGGGSAGMPALLLGVAALLRRKRRR